MSDGGDGETVTAEIQRPPKVDESLPFADAQGTTDTLGPADCLAYNRLHTAPPTLGTLLCRSSGVIRLVVVAKAAFSMDATPMDPAPAPRMHARDAYYRGRPMARVVAPSDMVPGRPLVDVTLSGHACAPTDIEVAEMAVRLMVRQDGVTVVDKPLLVVGDDGAPFSKMPIAYELAVGGRDNPIGVFGDEAPNILNPSQPDQPAGFGPIADVWPSRRRRLTKQQRAALDRSCDGPLLEIPEDIDWRYFQAAPEDQQIEHLAPDAAIVITGCHPERTSVAVQLPDAHAVGVVFGLHDNPHRPEDLTFRADTLHIDADALTCHVTWRAVADLPSVEAACNVLVVAGVTTARGKITLPKSRPDVPRRHRKPIVLPESDAPKKGQTVSLDSVREPVSLPFDRSEDDAS